MVKIELIQGDCLKIMDNFVSEGVKVDAVITDPPYKWSARTTAQAESGTLKNKV